MIPSRVMPRFAANLGFMFTDVPLADRFGAAARAGFSAVELLVPFELTAAEIARQLREHHLVNLGFNMHPGNWATGDRGIASLPGREAEFHRSVAQALEYAEVTGTAQCHPLAGIVPPGVEPARCRETYVDNVRFAAREAAKHGRTIVMETLNTRDMPGYFLTTWADAEAIRQEIGEPNVKFQMDLYHTQVAEGDLTMKLRRHIEHITHVQIAGVPDRHEPDEGEVDYRHIFRVLDELGYQGWIGCEYRPRGRAEEGLGWIRRLG